MPERKDNPSPVPENPVLAELGRMRNLSGPERSEAIGRFVRERVAGAVAGAARVTFGFPDRMRTSGFLHPESHIRVHAKAETIGFTVDDEAPYRECVERALSSGNVPEAIQETLDAYFGRRSRKEKKEASHDRRVAFYSARRAGPVSIRETKGGDFALCVEYAALAQNLIVLLGNKSWLVWANVSHRGETGGHVFNLIETPDGRSVLYDPNNPIETLDEKGNLLGTKPGAYPLPNEKARDLFSGLPVTIGRQETTRRSDGTAITETFPFTYNA
ncbi:MAG: hypothetical protein WCO25_06185 [Candidatus Uhrbacteria bacterium]